MRKPINAMGENNKLKNRWFKDVIASSASARGKKGNTYVMHAGQEHKSWKNMNRKARLVIAKLINIAGLQVILGLRGRDQNSKTHSTLI